MKKSILVAVAAIGAWSGVATAETFRNGQSIYGRTSTPEAASRIVDLAAAQSINVACGDTVTFINGAQRFTWKFDTATHSRVPLAKVAPPGFGIGQQVVYVSRNESENG